MIFVDSGYFIALASEGDELHARALQWTAIADRLVVSEYVLWETINHLSSMADRPKAHKLLTDVRSSDTCEVVAAAPALFDRGISLHRARSDKNWSLTDCISFCIMRDRGIREALAYDEHFEQAGFVALLRIEP
jgi:uncharacterized protein